MEKRGIVDWTAIAILGILVLACFALTLSSIAGAQTLIEEEEKVTSTVGKISAELSLKEELVLLDDPTINKYIEYVDKEKKSVDDLASKYAKAYDTCRFSR